MNSNNNKRLLFYYSNHCKHCQSLLEYIGNSSLKNILHFINIDNRFKQGNQILIRLENNNIVALHPSVKNVPTLIELNGNDTQITEGSNILSILKKMQYDLNMKATNNNGEPLAFGMHQLGGSVVSDYYSFLDQSSEEMGAKGNGGLRQMHNYVNVNETNSGYIQTPTENYSPDKISNSGFSIDSLKKQREMDIPRQHTII